MYNVLIYYMCCDVICYCGRSAFQFQQKEVLKKSDHDY